MNYYYLYKQYKLKYIELKNQIGGSKFIIKSKDFDNKSNLPEKFTCSGEKKQPNLFWENPPNNTKSFVLILDDPDAPNGTFTHLIAINISNNKNSLDGHTEFAKNSMNNNKYIPPCPLSGKHRYIFKLYALDKEIKLDSDMDKAQVLKKIKNNIIEETKLLTYFEK